MGKVAGACVSASGLLEGVHQITAAISDSLGNEATHNITIMVARTTPPVVIAPADIVVAADSLSGTLATSPTIAAFLAGASAVDEAEPPEVISLSENFMADL